MVFAGEVASRYGGSVFGELRKRRIIHTEITEASCLADNATYFRWKGCIRRT